MKITSGYGQITVAVRTKIGICSLVGTMCKYMGARNYTYQIHGEGSHIHGSRCNTWKHWKTISQNKHCCYLWWLRPTLWKGKQQHKSDSSGSTLHITHSKARTRSSIKVKMPLMESIVEVQFKKENSILHYKESFLEESYRQLFATLFLKKRWFENLSCTEHWTLWHYTIKTWQYH